MNTRRASFALAVLATLTACGESPTGISDPYAELVITQGAPAPVFTPKIRPHFSDAAAATNLGGSSSTPLSLKPESCDPGQEVVITFTITGNQVGTATFDVNTAWEYDGTNWIGGTPVTVSVPPRGPQSPATIRTVTITVVNGSLVNSGTSQLIVTPGNLTNTNQQGAKLSISASSSATVHVAFAECPVVNTPPTLVLPSDLTIEATSSAGAVVDYTSMVTATDLEDGDLTSSVICTPASGGTFPLGTTTVNCSITDSGGLTATGSFDITVVDTTPAFFTSFPTGTITLIAADINGAVLDIDALGITVEDVGHVSEPSTFSCDYVAGTALAIGSTTTVDCTASDAIGNTSDPSSFDVFVTLNVNPAGFLTPLRMSAPYSAHKRGSTIPHKFVPPTYADGTPALDLAGDLRLVMQQTDADPGDDVIEANDYGTGSSAWYLDDDGNYHFNVKTGKTTPWNVGTWQTTVSYMGITLATTQLSLVR